MVVVAVVKQNKTFFVVTNLLRKNIVQLIRYIRVSQPSVLSRTPTIFKNCNPEVKSGQKRGISASKAQQLRRQIRLIISFVDPLHSTTFSSLLPPTISVFHYIYLFIPFFFYSILLALFHFNLNIHPSRFIIIIILFSFL